MSPNQIRIPTVLALVLVAIFTFVGLFTYNNYSSFLSSAKKNVKIKPENVQITNVSDSSFVISWTTTVPVAASILYNDTQVAYDIRDSDSISKPYLVHYVVINGLEPSSSISLFIRHGEESFPIEPIILGPPINNPPQELPIYGQVSTSTGTPSRGAAIFATVNSEVVWSTFIVNSDSWIIPIASIRSSDLKAYYCTVKKCDDSTNITLQILSEEGTSTYQTLLSEARPVYQKITIGEELTIDVSPTNTPIPTVAAVEKKVQGLLATPTLQPTPTSKPSPIPVKNNWTVSIITPKADAALRFPKPLIRGLGVPNKLVDITLESSVTQVDQVTVQDDGTWLWTPNMPLESGEHTVTIKTVTNSGKPITLSRTFSIFKSGEQVLSASTPSATLVPTSTIIPTSTPIIPTATRTPELPVSASYAPSVLVLIGGIMLVLLGLVVL